MFGLFKSESSQVSIDTIKDELSKGKALVLDVREQDEWKGAHLTEAIHIPLSQLNKGFIPDNLPKDKKIYCHCGAGVRAKKAASLLKATHPQIVPVNYNVGNFKDAGFSVK